MLHTVEELEKDYAVRVAYVALDAYGNPELSDLERLLQQDDTKKMVSLMHINNEIGNKIPIAEIAKLCKKNDALLHSDTVQSIGHYTWDLQEVPIDFLTAAAHKFHGPKGVGFAFIRKNTPMKSLIFGGSQERGFRAGTESFHNIVGLETSFVAAYENLEKERAYVSELKQYFMNGLKKAIPKLKFNGYSGDMDQSTYTLVNVCLPFSAEKGMLLLFHLDLKGIACSKGSACQSGSSKGSHVLTEILSEADIQKPSLRFSFSKYNTKEDLDYTIAALKEFSEN